MEIGSFNELMAAAKIAGFRLEFLREDDHGFWTACWRRNGVVYKTVERRVPFNAALDAYRAARDAAAGKEPEEQTNDLFG